MHPSLARAVVCHNRRDRGGFSEPPYGPTPTKGIPMSKRARKRRSRKGNKANHGRKPNA